MKKLFNNIPIIIPNTNSFQKIIRAAKSKLYTQYSINENFIYSKKINELIFNDDCLYTYLFKEFLVYEDYNEFLKRFYNFIEAQSKLKRITEFYSKYSKIFPNYILLPESKILYRNIQKKQKMIDNLQEIKNEEEKQRKIATHLDDSRTKILNTSVQNSIFNHSNSFASNLNQIFNEDDYNDNEEQYNTLIDRLINTIEEFQKKNEEKRVIVKMISIKKKSQIEYSELRMFHSLSPQQKQNIGVLMKNKKQNASNSTNATSFLSTINNKSKEKAKGFDNNSNKYSYFISNGIMKKNSSMTSMTPLNKTNFSHVCNMHNDSSALLNNSVINLGNLTVKSQNTKIAFNPNANTSTSTYKNMKDNMPNPIQPVNKNKIPNTTNPLNFSKINIQSIKNKLQKNMFDVEYLTHRSNQNPRIDILKKNTVSKLDLMPSRNSLLSRLSQSLRNIHQNNNNIQNIRNKSNNVYGEKKEFKQKNNNRLKKSSSLYNALNKLSYCGDSERKSKEISFNSQHNNIFNHKPVNRRYIYQSN